jgi:hypothetical protein
LDVLDVTTRNQQFTVNSTTSRQRLRRPQQQRLSVLIRQQPRKPFTGGQRHHDPLEIHGAHQPVTGSKINLLISTTGQIPANRSDSQTYQDHNRDSQERGEDSDEGSHRMINPRSFV